MGRNQGWIALGFLASLLASADASSDPPELRVGAATSNITPDLGEPIIGNFHTPKATHVHDELHARCLVLDDGRVTLAIVVCDNVGIARTVFDAARGLIQAELGIDGSRVLLASTHTHSATSARGTDHPGPGSNVPRYHQFLARRIADGVHRAWNQRELAEVSWGAVDLPSQVFNRRWLFAPGFSPPLNPFGKQDQALMNPGAGRPGLREPAGPVDPQVSFLGFRNRAGRPIAVLANYSLHYVGGVPDGHISADYFGAFARKIGQKLAPESMDPPFVGILSNGTSGDVNNINVRNPAPAAPPYVRIDQVADELADAVIQGLAAAPYHRDVPLSASTREVVLLHRIPTPDAQDQARAILAKPEAGPRVHPLERVYASRILEMANLPPTQSVLLQAVRIGDVGIAAIPFEVFAETGLAIKRTSPWPRTFTIELANGAFGYLPTPRQHALGGYETWLGTNRVEVAASDKIEAAIRELLGQLAAPTP